MMIFRSKPLMGVILGGAALIASIFYYGGGEDKAPVVPVEPPKQVEEPVAPDTPAPKPEAPKQPEESDEGGYLDFVPDGLLGEAPDVEEDWQDDAFGAD